MDHLTEDTRALLRAAREIHAEHHGAQTFTQGTHLPLEEAGRRIGINPARLRYYDAIKELEYEGPASGARVRDMPQDRTTTSSPSGARRCCGNPARSPGAS